MFLKQTMKKNPSLIRNTMRLHQENIILPNSYVLDVDTFEENAKKILSQAKAQGIDLYFMLKQIGRNPYLAKRLVSLGYKGAVVVDFQEAKIMMEHQIPICNVGHLVQPCKAMIEGLVSYGCEFFTVYSKQKIRDLHEACLKHHKKQKILLRIADDEDLIYSGQTAGFTLEELEDIVSYCEQLSTIEIAGITSFPCFIYDEEINDIRPTHNLCTILKAKAYLEAMGIKAENVNTPSATSCRALELMKEYPITSAEPGHGFSATTPYHASHDTDEIPCIVYLSEISHNFKNHAYCFGGGHYRRSHAKLALVGKAFETGYLDSVICPSDESIDYHSD